MIVLSILLSFLLFIPYFAFKNSFFIKGQKDIFSSKRKLSLGEEILLSSIAVLPMHAFLLTLLSSFSKDSINILFYYRLFIGDTKILDGLTSKILMLHLGNYVLYIVAVSFFALIYGFILRFYVEKRGLDYRIESLKIYDKWYYHFMNIERDSIKMSTSPDFIFIQAIIKTASEYNCVNGVLINYELDENDNLVDIFLRNVTVTKRYSPDTRTTLYDQHGNFLKTEEFQNNSALEFDSSNFCLKYSDVQFLMTYPINISTNE